MRLYHYSILFAVLALALFMISDIKTNNLVTAAKEKENLDYNFSKAIDDAAFHFVEYDGMEGLKVNKERAVNDFFTSIYASMDITDKPESQERLKMYIPVIAITLEDGYYLYYNDEYKGSGKYTYVSRRWSEKLPFYYEDKDFIYRFTLTDILTIYDKNGLLDANKEQSVFTLDFHDLISSDTYINFRSKRPQSFLLNEQSFYLVRKENIISAIEDSMNEYCNQYNTIAKQYGITYHFGMPIIDNSEWSRSIDNPSIIVLFQGYPFGNGADNTYNRFAITGARINKKNRYYLEQKDWYYLYHKEDCIKLKGEGLFLLSEPYYSIQECVKKGAYACPVCDPAGVKAPVYNP